MNESQLLVAHPGRQHSHQLALALSQAGMLARYWTGVPVTDGTGTSPFARLMARLSPSDLTSLPEEEVQHCFIGSLGRKLPGWVLPTAPALWCGWQANRAFDRWCARRLEDFPQAAGVVCYETSALDTFREARRRGMTTVLDAASFHHVWQDRHFEYDESDRTHRAITQQKDEEIELADHVLTVSELARESYLEAGVAPERVSAVPVGCDLTRFAPDGEAAAPDDERGDRFTFVFAGYANRRKGIDVLLEAAGQLRDAPCRIVCAGGSDEALPWAAHSNVERTGRLPQQELAQLFQQSDCLVLPSRHDSFGMVVVEAMATGLPVVLSDHVGAKEAMEEGKTGWTVPVDDAAALAERMRQCVACRDTLSGMRDAAREAALAYSWRAYHKRVTECLLALRSVSGRAR